MLNGKSALYLILLLTYFFVACEKNEKPTAPKSEVIGLKNTFQKEFLIGAAINEGHINRTDTSSLNVIKREFNTITPENIMKWMYIHPSVDSFYFEMADQYVSLGNENDMHIVGHTLVWHSQLADWMLEIQDSTEMAKHLEQHVRTIVNRYKGKIQTWDVVNEALNEDGSYRESHFYKVMGARYIELAFKVASETDPDARLIYNDYNLWRPEKRAGVIRLVENLKSKGIKIDGIGLQGHYSLIGPEIKDVENSIIAFADLGMDVGFTELDVTALPNPWDLKGAEVKQNFEAYEGDPFMNPYPEGLPDSMQVKITDRYVDLFQLFLKYENKIDRVTFWGVNNGQSWLNNWPIKGRTNYPLLFNRQNEIQLAYREIVAIKESASRTSSK